MVIPDSALLHSSTSIYEFLGGEYLGILKSCQASGNSKVYERVIRPHRLTYEVASELEKKLALSGEIDHQTVSELKTIRILEGNPYFGARVYEDRTTGSKHYALTLNTMGETHLLANFDSVGPRMPGLNAKSTFSEIERVADAGGLFDFNGANSPHRGDDKHSYGAKPLLYFEITGVRS